MRQEALLKSFAQDGNGKNIFKKPSTRNVREKKNAKKKEPADHPKQELLKVVPKAKVEDEFLLPAILLSPSVSEVTVDRQASNLEEDSASDRTMSSFSGGAEDDDDWTRVGRKRTAAAGASQPKLKSQGSITSGFPSSSKASKPGETSPSADHLPIERKINGGTYYTKSSQGIPDSLKEDDSKAGESSSWIQPLLRRTHSVGYVSSSKPSPLEAKLEDEEEKLTDCVQHILLELEQTRQSERASMEKVSFLLSFARGQLLRCKWASSETLVISWNTLGSICLRISSGFNPFR